MTSGMEGRLRRLEKALLDNDSEYYRMLCFEYNLKRVDPEDLCECALAIIDRRDMDPETAKRIYAPIPPDAPAALVEEAKRGVLSPPPQFDSDRSIEQIRQEFIDYRERCREAKKFWRRSEGPE